MTSLDELCRIAEVEFAHLVVGTQALEPKRRLFIRDGSFVDVWVSSKLPGRFGFHWERTHLDGTFFRYDNFPDPAWRGVETFPRHFHDGSLDRVVASPFPPGIVEGFRAFMAFVSGRLPHGTNPHGRPLVRPLEGHVEALAVYCADVGAVPTGRFGWYGGPGSELNDGGSSIDELARRVAQHLTQSGAVALGFECPLFIPIPHEANRLGCARQGEGSRAWSAGAGAGVLATGLVQVVWLLREIRRLAGNNPRAFLDWAKFVASRNGLFIWEAFVSGSAKREGHVGDAKAAVEAFRGALPHPDRASAVSCDEAYSLVGAALLRTEWDTDLNLLSRPCIVIRAGEQAG